MQTICSIFILFLHHKKTNSMKEIFDLINTMSPYILLGFLLAGIMHAFLPADTYRRFLGKRSWRSIANATLLGIPLPLCSCGVIPTAMSLYKEGATKGATVSFLIATPQTGIDSIIATYSLLGLPFALLRPIAAIATALAGGIITNRFTDEKEQNGDTTARDKRPNSTTEGLLPKMRNALNYAFVEMMQDIGKWLIMGLVIAGLITVFVPDSFFNLFEGNSLLSMLFVLLLAIPMYLCATGSIPIAVALMLKGLSPGTAFVLLMAGPAVNSASMLVIGKVMGRKVLAAYLTSIVTGAIAFGLAIDHLMPREWFTAPLHVLQSHCHHGTPYFNIACTLLLAALLLNAFIRKYFLRKNHCHCHSHGDSKCSCHTEEERKTILTIEGMACNHCKANVEKVLLAIDGVTSVTVDLVEGTATIEGTFDKNAAITAVEAIGFGIKER